jgi:hypothetical protein
MFRTVLPNFFVVGTGKAGTTSLPRYLDQRPEVFMSPVKEPCYFAEEIRPENLSLAAQRHVARQSPALETLLQDGRPARPMDWLACGWQEYVRLFRNVRDEVAIGEASAAYLWSETAAANIHAHAPGARILILRDPAERAFSQYLHQLSVGLTRATFAQHLRFCLAAPHSPLGIHYPFLEIGLYARQVKRYLDLFPRDQVRIYWYEEAWRQPEQLLRDAFQFLGVDPDFRPDLAHQFLKRRAPRSVALHYRLSKLQLREHARMLLPDWARAWLRTVFYRRGSSIAMRQEDRRFLVDYYRHDIRELSALLNRDLSAWLR